MSDAKKDLESDEHARVEAELNSERARSRWRLISILHPMKDVIGSTLSRALLLPVSALAVFLSTRIVVDTIGLEGYAVFSLFIAIPLMIPISDFGISVSITDTLARSGKDSFQFRDVWRRTLRILSGVAAASIGIGVVLATAELWAPLLGLPAGRNAELTGFAMMTIMAVSIPLAAGQRVLLGIGKQTLSTIITSTATALSLLLIWVAVAVLEEPNAGSLAISYGLGTLIGNAVIFAYVLKLLHQPSKDHSLVQDRFDEPIQIFKAAIPMATLMIILPLIYQTDRLLLSHLGSLKDLADYSLVSVLYTPLLSTVTEGSQALWPLFMKMRADSPTRLRSTWGQGLLIFSSLGLVLMIGLVIVGPALTEYMSDGSGHVSSSLFFTFGLLLLTFGVHASSGMFLMNARGRAVQAIGAAAALLVKIPTAVYLIDGMGPAGAVLATLISVVIFIVLPTAYLALVGTRKP